MAGKVKRRKAAREKKRNFGFRWCDRPNFVGPSKGSPDTVFYILCTPHGWFTVKEEYVCWLVAAGLHNRKAFRKVYFPARRSGRTVQLKPKMKLRVQDLKEMHEEGIIDLSIGPWEHYGWDIGNKDIVYDPPRRDFSDIGLRQST